MINIANIYKFLKWPLVILVLAYNAVAQENLDGLPFQDGEEIVYVVYYNWGFIWVPAGEVKFSIKEENDHIEFNVIGKSFSSYDAVFKVRDLYQSQVDKKTLLPFNFRRDIHEGKYVRFDSIAFDQPNHLLTEYFGKSRNQSQKFEFKVEKVVHDMVSVIYNIRTTALRDLVKGSRIPVSIFFDKELFDLDVKFLGLEKKKIKDLGTIEAYHLQPELIEGYVFSKGDLMNIWVSADDNQVPLLIESPINIGSVRAVLRSTKGLKANINYIH